MSDSDDTDVLLLIPPDFFLVHSDSEDSYHENPHDPCGIVGTLINQVSNLENRVNRIESLDLSNSLDSNSSVILSEMSRDSRFRGDYRTYPDNYISSAKSTPQKPRNKFTVNSLPSTPSAEKSRLFGGKRLDGGGGRHGSPGADGSSFSPSPERVDKKRVLGEIDEFLHSVRTIQRFSAQKNLNGAFSRGEEPPVDSTTFKAPPIRFNDPPITLNDLKAPSSAETERRFSKLNLRDVDQLLLTMESQQREMELQDKELRSLYTNENFAGKTRHENSAADLGPEIRKTAEGAAKDAVRNFGGGISEMSTSESTSETVLERNPPSFVEITADFAAGEATGGLRNQSQGKVPNQICLSKPADNSLSSVNLFSLADIWNCNNRTDFAVSEKEAKKLLPKLEEEKCRRKHCEKLIQELQMKILEMQQRLAVAVQVDSAKDEAILRFHEAWEKVAQRWKSLESERNSLSKKLFAVEEKNTAEMADVTQKVAHYELEMAKAIDLTHKSQEKCNILESEKSALLSQLREIHSELKSVQINLQEVTRQREELAEKVVALKKESAEDKKLLAEARNEISHNSNVFATCQNELVSIKAEYQKLQNKIKEEHTFISGLELQRKNLQTSLDITKKSESDLQEEMKRLKEETERSKVELRNFYQRQVEVLVKEKLKEFQEQLEMAEKSMHEELTNKEQSLAKTAAKQIQKLTEKHQLEVHLLEEKRKEEVRLYELQSTQMKQQIHLLQNKLESHQAKQNHIAQELQHVMESQWLEALRIINTKSPPISTFHEDSKIQNPHFRLLDFQEQLQRAAEKKEAEKKEAEKKEQEEFYHNFRFGNFGVPLQLNKGPAQGLNMFETPVRSKDDDQHFSQNSADSELQKYIKLLLDKVPKKSSEKPMEGPKKSSNSSQGSSSSDFVDFISSLNANVVRRNGQSVGAVTKESRAGKPPWK